MSRIENLQGLDPRSASVALLQNIRQDSPTHKDLARQATYSTDLCSYQVADFCPLYSIGEGELQGIRDIWSTCFGSDGYLVDQEGSKVTDDMMLLETSIALLLDALQDQVRGTGDPASTHSLESMKMYARRYRPPAWRLAAMACHDLVEDAGVTLEEIGYICGLTYGELIQQAVDAYTEVRKTQKLDEKDRVQTILKLINALDKDPSTIAGKIFDRLHNMRTISGKPPTDRISIAADTLEVYYSLAKIIGLHLEADELADISYEILDEASYGPGYVREIKDGIETYLGQLEALEVKTYIQEITRELNIKDVDVRKPGIFAIAKAMRERRDPQQRDFYLNIDISLENGFDEGRLGCIEFAKAASDVVLQILAKGMTEGKFAISNGKERYESYGQDGLDNMSTIDIKRAFVQAVRTEATHHSFQLDYIKEGMRIPVTIRIYKKEEYDLERTPLTYLDAVVLSEDDCQADEHGNRELFRYRQHLAETKLARVQEGFQALRTELRDDETFVQSILTTLPDSIFVTGCKKKKKGPPELKRRPMRRGATILDYAIEVAPKSWQRVKGVEVNGKTIADFGILLKEEDVISLVFGRKGSNYVVSDWMEKVYPDYQDLIAQRLIEKIASLEKKEEHLKERGKVQEAERVEREKSHLIGAIRDRGWRLINAQVGNLDDFGLLFAQGAFPDSTMDPRDFAFKVGTGEYGDDVIRSVAEALRNFWQDSIVIVVQVPNVPNMSGAIMPIIGRTGLNIIKFESLSKWGDTSRLHIMFAKDDPEIGRLDEVIASIKKELSRQDIPLSQDAVLQFSTLEEYQDWLARYQG